MALVLEPEANVQDQDPVIVVGYWKYDTLSGASIPVVTFGHIVSTTAVALDRSTCTEFHKDPCLLAGGPVLSMNTGHFVGTISKFQDQDRVEFLLVSSSSPVWNEIHRAIEMRRADDFEGP